MELAFNVSSPLDGGVYRYGVENGDTSFPVNVTLYNVTDDPGNSSEIAPWPEKSLAEKLLIGCLLGIIIFCSVVGNTLVCIAVLTDRKLRRSSNFFYVSLACSDLLVALTVMTFAMANDIQGSWVFGPVFCNIWLSLDVMCCSASILNICAISLDRYLHIRKPYNYNQLMSPCRTLLIIVSVWVLSALISFLPIHLGWHKPDEYTPWQGERYICLLELNPLYAVSSSLVSFFIPCIIMLIMYINMYRLAKHHLKSIKATTASYTSAATEHAYKPSDHKASITLGVIMGVFLFCWMPFFTVNVITAFISLPNTVFIVCTWLGYINSMANPVIYTIFNKEFRNAFKKVLSLEKCCGTPYIYCVCHKHKRGSKTKNGFRNNVNGIRNSQYGALKGRGSAQSTSIPLMNIHNNNTTEL